MANPLVDALTAPAPATIPDPANLSWLQSLGVFEGRSLPDRNSALLQAGLTMMQAPTDGGGALSQFAGGVQAGLSDLDKTSAEATAAGQQAFTNTISQQSAAAETERAGATTTTAESSTVNAETGQQQVEVNAAAQVSAEQLGQDQLNQQIVEFNANFDTRAAKAAKDFADARMKDRLPVDAASGKPSLAKNTEEQFKANLGVAWADDQKLDMLDRKYDSQIDPRLHAAAWNVTLVNQGATSAENMAIIAKDTQDARGLGHNLQSFANPAAVAANPIPPTAQERSIATQMQQWNKARWQEAIDANDPQAEAMLNKFPGLKAHAIALMQGP